MKCQKALFAGYRLDQYADPETFKASVGTVLEQFPDEVISYITHPRTGIQRRIGFPPTIAEIVTACETQLAYLERLKQPKRLPTPMEPPPRLREMPSGALANVFVPETHPRYQAMVEWAKTAEPVWWKVDPSSDGRKGIWVNNSAWQPS